MTFKTTLFLLLISILPLGLAGQDESVIRDFIQLHRQGEENFAIKIPGWVAGLTGGIGQLASSDEEEDAAFKLAGQLGTTRVLTYLKEDFEPHAGVENLLFSLENYHGYDRWASVRAKSGEHVEVSIRYQNERIHRIIVAVEEPEEGRIVFVSAKTKLTAEELGRILEDIM